MDFNTHKKFAKLDDGISDPSTQGVMVTEPKQPEVREVEELDEEDKLAKIIADTILNQ